jgi:V8-like Glu-specific endopeptidase
LKYHIPKVSEPADFTADGSRNDPLTPDQLLEKDNEQSSIEMPKEFLESMSERRVHVSTVDGNAVANIATMAEDFVQTSSFKLPADTFLGRLGRDGRSYDSSDDSTEALKRPHHPQWQDRIYHPKLAPVPSSTWLKGSDGRRIRLHRFYDPENRMPFRPEGHPWTCIGRIEVFEFGQRKRLGTATLIGRRIILTSAHLMPRDGGAGRWSVLFVPGYFDGGSTVGMASWCEAYRCIVHPNDVGDSTQDRDLAILKLYDPLGDALGWPGIKTYNDDWEDQAVWTLVGYPDLTGGERPTFQSGIAVIDDDPSGDFTEVEHRGDATDGNSGGPLLAQFPDGPHIVSVHSGGEYRVIGGVVAEDNNVGSGGRGLVNFANTLDAEWP